MNISEPNHLDSKHIEFLIWSLLSKFGLWRYHGFKKSCETVLLVFQASYSNVFSLSSYSNLIAVPTGIFRGPLIGVTLDLFRGGLMKRSDPGNFMKTLAHGTALTYTVTSRGGIARGVLGCQTILPFSHSAGGKDFWCPLYRKIIVASTRTSNVSGVSGNPPRYFSLSLDRFQYTCVSFGAVILTVRLRRGLEQPFLTSMAIIMTRATQQTARISATVFVILAPFHSMQSYYKRLPSISDFKRQFPQRTAAR